MQCPDNRNVLSAQWGFHPGGWGKPPLDEYNRPLYGDVFGVLVKPETEVSMLVTEDLQSLRAVGHTGG